MKKKVGEAERRDYEIKQKGTQQNNVKAFYNIPYNKQKHGEMPKWEKRNNSLTKQYKKVHLNSSCKRNEGRKGTK